MVLLDAMHTLSYPPAITLMKNIDGSAQREGIVVALVAAAGFFALDEREALNFGYVLREKSETVPELSMGEQHRRRTDRNETRRKRKQPE